MTDQPAKANSAVDAAGLDVHGRLWVFAYGSLIWSPGFEYVSAAPATIYGYHRDLCVHSTVHRGTPQRTGLVLGLAPGGACRGVLFEVAERHAHRAIEGLDARELATDVYKIAQVPAALPGRRVPARTYICNTAHEEYAGRLAIEDMARRVHGAVGNRGPNEEYLINSVAALRRMGLRDRRLEAVHDQVIRAMQR